MTPARIALGAALADRDAKEAAFEAAKAAHSLARDHVDEAFVALTEAEAAGRDRRDALVESIRKAASGASKAVKAPKENTAVAQRQAALETADAAQHLLYAELVEADDAFGAASLAVDIAAAAVMREEFVRQVQECEDAIALLTRRHFSMNALVAAASTHNTKDGGFIPLPLTYDERNLLLWKFPSAPFSSPDQRKDRADAWRAYRAALKVDPAASVPADLAD